MVRDKVKGIRAYFDGISAVIDVDECDFADVYPAEWLHEMPLVAAGLEGPTSSQRQRDFARGDRATRAKPKDSSA